MSRYSYKPVQGRNCQFRWAARSFHRETCSRTSKNSSKPTPQRLDKDPRPPRASRSGEIRMASIALFSSGLTSFGLPNRLGIIAMPWTRSKSLLTAYSSVQKISSALIMELQSNPQQARPSPLGCGTLSGAVPEPWSATSTRLNEPRPRSARES